MCGSTRDTGTSLMQALLPGGNLHGPSVPLFYAQVISCKIYLLSPCFVAVLIVKTRQQDMKETSPLFP